MPGALGIDVEVAGGAVEAGFGQCDEVHGFGENREQAYPRETGNRGPGSGVPVCELEADSTGRSMGAGRTPKQVPLSPPA